jgi:hypothetical protein
MSIKLECTLIVVCIWMYSDVKLRGARRVLGLVLLGSCEPGGVLSHMQHMTKILVGLSLRRNTPGVDLLKAL